MLNSLLFIATSLVGLISAETSDTNWVTYTKYVPGDTTVTVTNYLGTSTFLSGPEFTTISRLVTENSATFEKVLTAQNTEWLATHSSSVASATSTGVSGYNSTTANSNSTYTNVTSNSTSLESSLPQIKLYSFSDEFTELYSNKTGYKYSKSLTLLDILEDYGVLNSTNISGYSYVANFTDAQLNSTAFVDLYDQLTTDLDSIDGAVISVGKEYIEDLAFFLDLVLNTTTPIVLFPEITSANLAGEGGENIARAVLVAGDEDAEERGALVIDGPFIISSLYYSQSDEVQSVLGEVYESSVIWFYPASTEGVRSITFDISDVDSLPSVATIYNYNGLTSDIIEGLSSVESIEGLIVASTESQSTFSSGVISAIENYASSVPVVLASSAQGDISLQDASAINGTIAAGILDPIKARILLQVSLASDFNTTEIKNAFSSVYGG